MTAKYLLLMVALLACGAVGQEADDASTHPPAKPAAKAPRAVVRQDPFAVTNWFDIPSGTNIAQGSDPHTKKVDLAVREDASNINVYGHKEKFERRDWFRHDQDEPFLSVPSVDMPVRQNSSCEGAAYDTVGGQPATGRDLVGALGAGSAC